MRKILLAAVAMTGFLTLTMPDASAAQSSGSATVHAAPGDGIVTNVDYHHWHHRHG